MTGLTLKIFETLSYHSAFEKAVYVFENDMYSKRFLLSIYTFMMRF